MIILCYQKYRKDLFDKVIKMQLCTLLNEEFRCFHNFYTSKWVQMLRDNQRIWSIFHSQNSKIKQKYGTTEKAIECIQYSQTEKRQ